MLKKEDYNVTAQDRLQFAQYELLLELVTILSGTNEQEALPEPLQEKINESTDNNSIIQELKTLEQTVPKSKVGGEIKDDKVRNSKKRKTTDK